MMKNNRHDVRTLALSHLWIYQTGLDDGKSEAEVTAIAGSLAILLDDARRDAVRNAPSVSRDVLSRSTTHPVGAPDDWDDMPTRQYARPTW